MTIFEAIDEAESRGIATDGLSLGAIFDLVRDANTREMLEGPKPRPVNREARLTETERRLSAFEKFMDTEHGDWRI